MTIDEIKTAVEFSARLRIPRFTDGERATTKIERLENYMLDCAHARGELEAAWRWAMRLLLNLEDQWADVECDRARTIRAEDLVRRAKRPDLYDALREARQIKQDIEHQVHRLKLDEATASRAYTFITGN